MRISRPILPSPSACSQRSSSLSPSSGLVSSALRRPRSRFTCSSSLPTLRANCRLPPLFFGGKQFSTSASPSSAAIAATAVTAEKESPFKMMSSAPPSNSPAVPPSLFAGKRKYAPLDPEKGGVAEADGVTKLRGVIFDVDGTLCLPQNYMFREMRAALNISKSTDILTHIRGLPTRPERAAAVKIVQSIERRAMTQQRPQPHLLELMQYLEKRGIRKGLCTRNFPAPVEHLREHFLPGIEFEGVVTRDTPGIRAKPHGDGLWMIVEGWNENDQKSTNQTSSSTAEDDIPRPQAAAELTSPSLPTNANVKGVVASIIDEAATTSGSPTGATEDSTSSSRSSTPPPTTAPPPPNPYLSLTESEITSLRHAHGTHLIMVGDSIDDLLAGRHAGAATVLLVNEENAHLQDHEACDLGIKSLGELVEVLERGFEGVERGAAFSS